MVFKNPTFLIYNKLREKCIKQVFLSKNVGVIENKMAEQGLTASTLQKLCLLEHNRVTVKSDSFNMLLICLPATPPGILTETEGIHFLA